MASSFTDLGSANARVVIDLSQAASSIPTMQQIADKIADIVSQINKNISQINSTNSTNPASAPPAVSPQLQAAQKTQQQQTQAVDAEKELREKVLNEIRITNQMITQARGQVSLQSNLFQQSAAGAPPNVDQSDVRTQLAAARQPIIELQNQLAALKTQYLQATSPQEEAAIIPELQRIQAAAEQAANEGMTPLIESVMKFEAATVESTSGIQGYFNMIRENLEQINETSLAANLQEIAFRLLPMGLATGGATKQGLDTAQQIQEMALSFNSFTKSQQASNELMDMLISKAEKFGLPMTEVLTTMQKFAPTIREAGGDIGQVMDLVARVLTLDPGQGFTTAMEAVTKGLGGTDRSLLSQFHILPETIKAAVDQTGSFTAGLDKVLNDMGRTTAVAEQFGDTTRAAFTRMGDSANRFLASSMKPFLDALTQGANGISAMFDRMEQGGGILATLTGGFLLLTTALTSSLMTLSQLALGLVALRALLPTNFASNLFDSAINHLTAILPTTLLEVFASVASGISAIIATAVQIGVKAAPIALSIVGGAVIGTDIAAAAGVGGTHDQGEEADRLIKIVSGILPGLAEAFLTAGAIFTNVINYIVAVFQNLGAVMDNVMGHLEVGIGQFLLTIANFAEQFLGKDAVTPLTEGAKNIGMEGQGRIDRAAGTMTDLSGLSILPSESQKADIQNKTNQLWLNVYNFLSHLLQPTKATDYIPPSAGGAGAGGAGAGGNTPDAATLEKVYGAAIQSMISTTRLLEDRALSAQRSAEDFAIQRQRSVQDFNSQMMQSETDYYSQRQQKQDDFARQSQDAVDQEQKQRKKQTTDFNAQELRARQDHLTAMKRLGQDVDDAASARDFLSAQKTLENMQRQEEDFNTADARRQEDFQNQLKDLDTNLATQQAARKADFERQQKQADDSFRLQQQRQLANFQLQQQRQDADRQRQLARQAQDEQIADQRRQQDFMLQMVQLADHNTAMTQLWKDGLDSLADKVSAFFDQLGIDANVSASGGGQIVPGLPAPSNGGTQGAVPVNQIVHPNQIVRSFDEGAWKVPYDGIFHLQAGEKVQPMPYAEGYRKAIAEGGAQGGDTYQVVLAPVFNGNQNKEEIRQMLQQEIIPEMTRQLERQSKQKQPARGRN